MRLRGVAQNAYARYSQFQFPDTALAFFNQMWMWLVTDIAYMEFCGQVCAAAHAEAMWSEDRRFIRVQSSVLYPGQRAHNYWFCDRRHITFNKSQSASSRPNSRNQDSNQIKTMHFMNKLRVCCAFAA